MEQGKTNLLGQKMGRKGRDTRKKIMDVTLEMLKSSSYKDLTISELAHEAGVSSSTFYVYFEDIEDVLFACVEAAALDVASIIDILHEDWDEANLEQKVQKFVEEYNKLWSKHRVELRIRNLEAEQGNLRFLNYRIESTHDIQVELGKKIAQINPAVKHPYSIATVVFSSMEVIAAAHDLGIGGATRQTRRKLIAGMVELLFSVLSK